MTFPASLAELWSMLHADLEWLKFHFLVWNTVLQLAYAAALLLLLWLAGPRLVAALLGMAERLHAAALQRTAVALARVAPWAVVLVIAWFGEIAFDATGQQTDLLRLLESCSIAWVVIRISSGLVRDPRLARFLALAAFLIAALNIFSLLGPTGTLLSAMAVTIGTLRISALLVLKGTGLLWVLIWTANALSHVFEQRLRRVPNVAPPMQVLATKLVRLILLLVAVVAALGAIGIDLTAFAVFSGAIGVGIGFGLQSVVSNLVSGVILLVDRSIKPGDVIEIGGSYGWISGLNARYASVVTRDGIEHLIPNQDLITQRVVNWSYSSDLVRLHVPIGVSYLSNVHDAMRIGLEAVAATPRALAEPHPVCLLTGFGDSTVNLELRFWISDPRKGTANARSEVLVQVWDRFKSAGIELPFPQRDLNIRDAGRVAEQVAQAWRDSGSV